jgi:hypothetical protein
VNGDICKLNVLKPTGINHVTDSGCGVLVPNRENMDWRDMDLEHWLVVLDQSILATAMDRPW